MTNLLGTVIILVTTNWNTVHTSQPQCHAKGCLENHYDTIYQVGTIETNTVLRMVWKGEQKDLVLESQPPGYMTRFGQVELVNTYQAISNANRAISLASNATNQLLIAKPKK